ncbi:MAG: protein translocase subunit SecF [Candidatus Nanohaloarchaea archaeon]
MEWADNVEKRSSKMFDKMYEDYDKYFVVPLLLILIASGVLFFNFATTGEFLEKGTDFAGGTEITFEVEGDFSSTEVEQLFADNGRPGTSVLTQDTGERQLLLVQVAPPEIEREEALEILESGGYEAEVDGFNSISAAVSGQFFQQAQFAFILAFTVMSTVIFYAFKDFTPSIAVVFAAGGDILIAAAGMSLIGVPLSLGSLAALLMLIGYSVDTDIVLSTRILKMNRGTVKSRMWSSMKTGLTMSSGGIAGFTLLYLISVSIVGPSALSNIAAVMVIGLLADIPLTWMGNTIILKKYVEGDFDSISSFRGGLPWK